MLCSAKASFKKEEVADYEQKRYRGLDQRIVHRREVGILKTLLSLAESASPSAAPAYALDAPCGYGRFSGLLQERNFRLVSLDLSPAMVERAVEKGLNNSNPIGIVSNMAEGLPFKPNIFRLILSMRLFHHLHESEERRSVLREFARASNGWVILSFYQVNPLHLAQRRLRRRIKRSKTRIKMITRREFEEEADEAGFEIVRVVPLFRGIHAQQIALLRLANCREKVYISKSKEEL
jgi:SAM-dependent methyltransferase